MPSKNAQTSSVHVRFILKSVPSAENCFSIIGPNTLEGAKSLNIECESRDDANKWVEYIEVVINYFRKNQKIKSLIVKK